MTGGTSGTFRASRLIGLIGLIGLLSCSHDNLDSPEIPEEPPVTGTAIAFTADEQQEAMVTRATTSLHDKGVGTFKVWSYKNTNFIDDTTPISYGGVQTVMDGYTVNWMENSAATTPTNSHNWEYAGWQDQTIKYWDWGAAAYRFFALADMGKSVTESAGTNGATVNGAAVVNQLSFEADAKSENESPFITRLWFSNGSDPNGKPFGQYVQLEFLRPFAKVRFMFTFVSEDPNVTLDDLHLSEHKFLPATNGQRIVTKGTFTVTYPLTGTDTKETWEMTPGTNTSDYIYNFSTPYTEDNPLWYTVMAIKNQGAYMLTVLVNGDEKTCYVPAEYMDWLPGYSYTYIFKVNDDGGVEFGQVYTAYTNWQHGGEKDYIIYNW